MACRADIVVPILALERRLAAGCRVVHLQRLELVGLGRRDRQVGIGPAVGRLERLVEQRLAAQIDARVFRQLDRGADPVARIEDERILPLHAGAPVAAEFEPQRAAFERMHALEQDHQIEPQDGRQRRARPPDFAGASAAQDRVDVLRRVERVPGGAIGLLPVRVRHGAVVRDAVIEVVFVHVGVHPDALGRERLVVLRSGQRRQEEKFENIDRQFALDDLDIAQDRFLAVGGEAENVAGIGDGAVVAPHLQHLAVFGDLVLPFLGGDQVVRVDVLEPDEGAPHAGFGRLLDEARNLVAERIDLDGEADVHALADPHLDHAVEQRLPILVAREIVVGDEEALDAFGVIRPHDVFQIVGRADAALAALHVDDGAERALVRAAAAEIDARQRAGGALDVLARQERRRLAGQGRQIVHVIVERLERAVEGIAQHIVEPAILGFAGEERNPELLRRFDVGRQLRQHGDAAGDMEAADADRQAGVEKRFGQIDGARKLVRLHADQTDQRTAAFAADHADDLLGLHPPVGFVERVQADIDARSQHLTALGVLRQGIQASERIGGNRRAQPLDRIAVVVVMRRLDHDEVEDRGSPTNGRVRHTYSCPTRALPPAADKMRYFR